jgi:hypothetical protein
VFGVFTWYQKFSIIPALMEIWILGKKKKREKKNTPEEDRGMVCESEKIYIFIKNKK